jgi:hypothetical protein
MLLSKEEVAKRLSISPLSLSSQIYRARIGLPAIKIGSSLRFRESDIQRLIDKGQEHLPAMASKR